MFCSLLSFFLTGKFVFSGGNEIVVWTHDLRRVHTIAKGYPHPILSMAVTIDFVLHTSTWYLPHMSCFFAFFVVPFFFCSEDIIKKFQPMNEDLTSWSSIGMCLSVFFTSSSLSA
jgi:hypothetical protein